jgi:hypothetical protein
VTWPDAFQGSLEGDPKGALDRGFQTLQGTHGTELGRGNQDLSVTPGHTYLHEAQWAPWLPHLQTRKNVHPSRRLGVIFWLREAVQRRFSQGPSAAGLVALGACGLPPRTQARLSCLLSCSPNQITWHLAPALAGCLAALPPPNGRGQQIKFLLRPHDAWLGLPGLT